MTDDNFPERSLRQLREEWKSGNDEVRQELAELLMRQAQIHAGERAFDLSIPLIDEAIGIVRTLVDEGQVEFRSAIGRCLLFRAINIRFRDGPSQALAALDEVIQYLVGIIADGDRAGRNELAVALMNKADILNDPLGAHSAAIGIQDQAIRIWEKLVDEGDGEYRGQLATALAARADSRLLSGDRMSALNDYRTTVGFVRGEIEQGDLELRSNLVHLLSKLTKLYEQVGDFFDAFETSTELIQLVQTLIEEGDDAAEALLTAFHLQRGMLFERVGDSKSALAEYDLCRDVYHRLNRGRQYGDPGEYFLQTGLANVMMCRGNMLSDMKRFDDAKASFEEAIRSYQRSTEFRPETDDDETFVLYSIAVVQLNYANMLAAQGQLAEVIPLQETAIETLHRRIADGHPEILPNLLSAYRKMVNIQRMRNDHPAMFLWTDKLIAITEKVVDDGELEYRNALADAYHLRSICFHEAEEYDKAISDNRKALRLFREIADEEVDSPEVDSAKVLWSNLLGQIALVLAGLGRIDEGIAEFQRAVDDMTALYDEGNVRAETDITLALTQFSDFLGEVLRKEIDKRETDEYKRWETLAQEIATRGLEFEGKRNVAPSDGETDRNAPKLAFFHFRRGESFAVQGNVLRAMEEFTNAANEWEKAIHEVEQERLIAEYNAKEAVANNPEYADKSPLPDLSGALPRLIHFMSEFRQSLQAIARCLTGMRRFEEALEPLRRDGDVARRMLKIGGTGAELLILSLQSYAEGLERADRPEEAVEQFEEILALLRQRIEMGPINPIDLSLAKHCFCAYALFLAKHEKIDNANTLIHQLLDVLDSCVDFPPSGIWLDACRSLDVCGFWTEGDELVKIFEKQRELIARHPEFEMNNDLKEYDAMIAREIAELIKSDCNRALAYPFENR